MMKICAFEQSEWASAWKIIEPVFQSGETYAYSPTISEQEAYNVWIESPQATYVTKNEDGIIVGTYYIKPNQPGLGAHVCNCGYIVEENHRCKGVASFMCKHSQEEAKKLGFLAMQFNLIVSTNELAVKLWHKLGFETVGTLTNAFNHLKYGFVDAFVMYKQL